MSRKQEYRSKKHPSGKVANFPINRPGDKRGLPVSEFPLTSLHKDTTEDPRYAREVVMEKAKKYTFGDMVVEGFKDVNTQGWKLDRQVREANRCLEKMETGHGGERISAEYKLRKDYPEVWRVYQEQEPIRPPKEEQVYEPGD